MDENDRVHLRGTTKVTFTKRKTRTNTNTNTSGGSHRVHSSPCSLSCLSRQLSNTQSTKAKWEWEPCPAFNSKLESAAVPVGYMHMYHSGHGAVNKKHIQADAPLASCHNHPTCAGCPSRVPGQSAPTTTTTTWRTARSADVSSAGRRCDLPVMVNRGVSSQCTTYLFIGSNRRAHHPQLVLGG